MSEHWLLPFAYLHGSLTLQGGLASGHFPRPSSILLPPGSSATMLLPCWGPKPYCSLHLQCWSPDGHMVHSQDSFGSVLKCHLLAQSPIVTLFSLAGSKFREGRTCFLAPCPNPEPHAYNAPINSSQIVYKPFHLLFNPLTTQ